MKIHVPKTDKQKDEEKNLKKECLALAIKVAVNGDREVTAEKVIEMANKFSNYVKEDEEKES